MIVERKVKIITEQHNIDKPSVQEGFPMKEWSIEIYLLDDQGNEKDAKVFNKVVYNLHPSFPKPVQTFHTAPFRCSEEGWGEFEMSIDFFTTEKGGKQTVMHDLNFQQPTYEMIYPLQFKNPSQALQALLRETGPLPSDEDRKVRKEVSKKKKSFDIEKMAEAIGKLGEDDLLHIIQLIHDHKSEDTYIVNNTEVGEFSVDLYTIPDNLGKLIWEFLLTTPQAFRLK